MLVVFLCQQKPHLYTIERLKKNRHNKLYLDYVQHAEGKTIIAPYSTRGNELGLVATPLHWEEVNANLKPYYFFDSCCYGANEEYKQSL
ncbi:hypothetical protein OL548_23270 [Lysinibacillus sp. MHQ-1]|nr:hypothetical protein OL548_23270 [Lysinibacillus sp. MHQ-1]